MLEEWAGHPSIVLGLSALLLAYVYAIRRETAHARVEVVRTWQVVCFGAALITIYVALASPLHDLSERYLFSAHMVQHLLLTMMVPPLLLVGTPGWMVRALVRRRPVFLIARWLTAPIMAFGLFNLVFALSHLPALYDLSLENHSFHIVEHLVFLATSVLMWWPILSPLPELPRLAYPLQMLYLFLQTIPGSAVGSLIALAEAPLYAVYAQAPRVWGISALVDQQVGGLLMWVGGAAYFLVAATVVFFIWAHRENAHAAV